jgi:hypothetical protein
MAPIQGKASGVFLLGRTGTAKGWLRIDVTNMEILIRRLNLAGHGILRPDTESQDARRNAVCVRRARVGDEGCRRVRSAEPSRVRSIVTLISTVHQHSRSLANP